MATLTHIVKIDIQAALQPNSPYAGSVVHRVLVDRMLANGTGAYQADKCYQATLSVGASGSEVDLVTQTDAYGVAMSLDEVVTIAMQGSLTNTAAVNVTGGASNPWEALLLATGDGLSIKPGLLAAFHAPLDGSLPVTGTAKTLKFAAASGTQSIDVIIIGRSQ